MEICFTKRKEGSHIISCKRNNGTVTWMHSSSFFILHDICHYAAETQLGFTNAFYGMLASGIAISDFELPGEQRPFALTNEAIITEHIVNLLGIEYNQGRMDNFELLLANSLKGNHLAPIYLDTEKLEQIRTDIRSLMKKWTLLNEGGSLTLSFNE